MFGHYVPVPEPDGSVTSLMTGQFALHESESMEDFGQYISRALKAVNIAGLFAQARERGIPPQLANFSKRISQEATEGARLFAEFHYAFELTKILARIEKKNFKLKDLPIDLAPESVQAYLGESSRLWLDGLHGASVVLSRASLELSLRARLEGKSDAVDCLEALIDKGPENGLLALSDHKIAHTIRRGANAVLHGDSVTELQSREALEGVRTLVERLFISQ